MTADELSRAEFDEVLRVDTLGGGYLAQYECRADPRVSILVARPLRWLSKRVEIHVGRASFPRGDWTGAAGALARLNAGEAL